MIKDTFKDRKFWAGMVMGGLLAGSIALLQPLQAAPPAPSATDVQLQNISKALLAIGLDQRKIITELQTIKTHAAAINTGVSQLKDTANINPTAPPR